MYRAAQHAGQLRRRPPGHRDLQEDLEADPGADEAPKSTDASKGWAEVLTAAALQGAIFAVVTASMERLAAVGTRSLTGTWPGEDSDTQADSGSDGKAERRPDHGQTTDRAERGRAGRARG